MTKKTKDPSAADAGTSQNPKPQDPKQDQAGDGADAGGAGSDSGDAGDDDDGDDGDEAEDLRLAEEARRIDAERAAKAQPSGKNFVRENNGNSTVRAVSLMLEACDRFGVNPSADKRPVELLAWRYYQGDDDAARIEPDSVVIVTAGGIKLRHFDDPDVPMDLDTKATLERVFGSHREDPKTKQIVTSPLPADLTLPAVAVTGISTSTEHKYVGGYLKSGGKKAAADKAARASERAKRAGLAK